MEGLKENFYGKDGGEKEVSYDLWVGGVQTSQPELSKDQISG